jgi:serine/threonine protein kinase
MWLSMEYVDGQDASTTLRGPNPVPLDLAVRIIDGAGNALDYAYAEHRITHRDVKPANILLAFGRGDSLKTVKLADFGIAKAAAESTSLTGTGVTIGTMAYISPEAIEGCTLDNGDRPAPRALASKMSPAAIPPARPERRFETQSTFCSKDQHLSPTTVAARPRFAITPK